MSGRWGLIGLALGLATFAPWFDAQEKYERPLDTRQFLLSPELVMEGGSGSIRLAHSVLLADEMGATDFHQAELLSDRVQARKVFVLDSADVKSAELLLFGSAQRIHVNGKPLTSSERLVSTGWARAAVPPDFLRAGDNEVVLSGGGQLLFEPGRRPGRSFKSVDAGRSWSSTNLGDRENQQGEYLVRLRLGRHAPTGSATSPVIDLWASRPDEIATPAKLIAIQPLARLTKEQAQGTRITTWLRTGTTPVAEPKTWTNWIVLDGEFKPAEAAARHRWAQLKFDLATGLPQATSRVPAGLALSFQLVPDAGYREGKLVVAAPKDDSTHMLGSVPFDYQGPSPRLKLLRERYQLDRVIAGGKTEMEQLMLLRHWVRNQWHTAWGSHPAAWMPPWDALVILESRDQPDCLTMCTHYAAIFTQCSLALGWNARHCILDHHCVSEVWVDQHRKWVMMDAGNSAERADVGLHFERHGVPLSALELHLAQRTGKRDGITVCFTPAALAEKIAPLCRPAPSRGKAAPRPDQVALADLYKFPVCGLDNYRRYAFPGRNNYLSSLLPGELYQGWSEYFYDGYCWVGDSADGPRLSPEYSRQLPPSRPQDIDWPVNWSRLHLSRTGRPGEVQVDVEHHTPNLARLERWTEGSAPQGSWQATEPRFVWKLRSGANVLRIRSVNAWERAGSEARVQVQWTSSDR